MTDFVHARKPTDPLETIAVCGERLFPSVARCANPAEVTCPLCKAYLSLTEINRYNNIGNDLDAYLFELAEWGLSRRDKMPQPDEYGLVSTASALPVFGKD